MTIHQRKFKNSDLQLWHEDALLANPSEVERQYNAKYLGEFTLKNTKGNWVNTPVAIFYTPQKHPEGSNYFGLYINSVTGVPMITNGLSAVIDPETGEKVEYCGINVSGYVIYSAYRHDFQKLDNAFIDGGRDYIKSSFDKLVAFTIEDNELVLKESP